MSCWLMRRCGSIICHHTGAMVIPTAMASTAQYAVPVTLQPETLIPIRGNKANHPALVSSCPRHAIYAGRMVAWVDLRKK
jgi:hypothetical protein